MSSEALTSYDEVPYASHPFPQTRPDRLATVATLFGLRPPPVVKCRVLEIGCASGGNLLPMADSLPESSFFGIDLSGHQINEGQQAIAALGLRNIELRHLSVTDIGPGLGLFDFIICHGVYSWVAHPVQEKILDVCAKNLAPGGVAYVSYNTLPGWRMRGMIRDMMRFHAEQFATPTERVGQARALLDFLARSAADEGGPYSTFLRSQLELLAGQADAYVLHEHLEEHNEPLYFHQFIARAATHGLRYLGEADIPTMVPANFPPPVKEVLDRLGASQVHLEQYMDFLRNRSFRQTLLCHAETPLDYRLSPERLAGLTVASPVRPVSASPDLASTAEEQFRCPSEVTMSSRDPIVKAALLILAEQWPRAIPFPKLRALARARLSGGSLHAGATIAQDTATLGETLWNFYATASTLALGFSVRPVPAMPPSDRPEARALGRWQAKQVRYATNLRHEAVPLNELECELLPHLDGAHDRNALLRVLENLVARGDLALEQEGEPVTDPIRREELLRHALEEQLRKFARNSLLVR